MFPFFLGYSGRTEEEVLKKAAERFNVAPEKITLKQGTLKPAGWVQQKIGNKKEGVGGEGL